MSLQERKLKRISQKFQCPILTSLVHPPLAKGEKFEEKLLVQVGWAQEMKDDGGEPPSGISSGLLYQFANELPGGCALYKFKGAVLMRGNKVVLWPQEQPVEPPVAREAWWRRAWAWLGAASRPIGACRRVQS